jgi:hypothetical protein
VAAIYLGQQMKPEPAKAPATAPAAERTFITLDPAATRQFEGMYRVGDLQFEVTQKGGKLLAGPVGSNPQEIQPTAPNRFYAAQMKVDVEFTPKPGNGMAVRIMQNSETLQGERVVFSPFDPKDLEKYPGAYWSEELETQYTIVLKDGKLTASHAHHGEIPLRPVAKDELASSTWFMPSVRFTRDAAGAVNGVVLGGNRVAGVRFVRR